MSTKINNKVKESYCNNNKVKESYCNNNNDSDRAYNIDDNERSGNVNWWINELETLGINKKSSSNSINEENNKRSELSTSQQLEDLTDDIKQVFIRDYKVCYSQ
jgi:hypothetical protein